RDTFQVLELLDCHGPLGDRTHGLEDVLNRHLATLPFGGGDAPAVEVDARNVEPSHRHRACGLCLVAASYGDDGVELVTNGCELYRVSDHLAADQGGLHPFVPHRDRVVDR